MFYSAQYSDRYIYRIIFKILRNFNQHCRLLETYGKLKIILFVIAMISSLLDRMLKLSQVS